MKAQKRLVPEWGVELDGVWFPAALLEELSEQGRYDSQAGSAFIAAGRDQEKVLLARGLAEKETKGGLHAGPAMPGFWDALEFPGPAPDRRLTPQERIEARHWLQVLSEHARSVRNAMDPLHGMTAVTVDAWAAQWQALKDELDSFTHRVIENRPSAGGIGDRNERGF